VSDGTVCQLGLTIRAAGPIGSGSFQLAYGYTNNAGTAAGTVTVSYTANPSAAGEGARSTAARRRAAVSARDRLARDFDVAVVEPAHLERHFAVGHRLLAHIPARSIVDFRSGRLLTRNTITSRLPFSSCRLVILSR
jgi:hypothetical protein